MASVADSFEEPHGSAVSRLLPWLIGALLIAGIAWFVYSQFNKVVGVKQQDTPPTVIDMVPPPPPPPPPPPTEKPPPEPTPPEPSPAAPEPTPQKEAPAPMQIDGPAQAGTDSFGLQSGAGGGTGAPGSGGTCLGTNCGGGGGGGGFSDAMYRRALGSALQDEVQRNNKVNRLVFEAEFMITVTPEGNVSKVELVRGSGQDDRDKVLQATLEAVRGLEPPPKDVKFPQRIKVRGRRSV